MSETSKTDVPCDCGWLATAMNDPDSGVSFDAKSNRIMLGNKTLYSMYHCPFCGGRFPDPDGPVWVPIIPLGERARLDMIIRDLNSADAIHGALGPPDNDQTLADSEIPTRHVEYHKLSEWYNVEFYLLADGNVHKRLSIKQIPPRPG